jgi:hypothetical protein
MTRERMKKLRIPSLQHAARNASLSVESISQALIALAKNSPPFSYAAMISAVRDLLVLGVPYAQVEAGIRTIKWDWLRENFLEILPMLHNHFKDVRPDYVNTIARRYYPAGRGLLIPFEPPMLYCADGQKVLPWFVFWKNNPVVSLRLSFFATIVRDIMDQDPELDDAELQILEFSCITGSDARAFVIRREGEIPRLDDATKTEMLSTFAEGYLLAQATLAKEEDEKNAKKGSSGKGGKPP